MIEIDHGVIVYSRETEQRHVILGTVGHWTDDGIEHLILVGDRREYPTYVMDRETLESLFYQEEYDG